MYTAMIGGVHELDVLGACLYLKHFVHDRCNHRSDIVFVDPDLILLIQSFDDWDVQDFGVLSPVAIALTSLGATVDRLCVLFPWPLSLVMITTRISDPAVTFAILVPVPVPVPIPTPVAVVAIAW